MITIEWIDIIICLILGCIIGFGAALVDNDFVGNLMCTVGGSMIAASLVFSIAMVIP